MPASSLALNCRAWERRTLIATPVAIPASTIRSATIRTHRRCQTGGLRTTSCGRGGAAMTRRLLVRPFPLIANERLPALLLHEAGYQDREFVKDYQGNHQCGHREPVLARRDDGGHDGDHHDRVAPPRPELPAGENPHH